MPDIVDPATRSRMMSRIRGKDTEPEMRVRRRLHAAGLRYRLHVRELPGKPDLVFVGARTVVFVHGCFWHQHPGCKLAYMPGTNVEFWQAKLHANTDRDTRVTRDLTGSGWHVETVWECEIDARIDELSSIIGSRLRPVRVASARR